MFGFSVAGFFSAIPYLGLVLSALMLYNSFWENPGIKRDARAGYVAEVQLATVQGQLAEVKRQADASQKASDLFQEALVKVRTEEAASAATLEESIQKYIAENPGAGTCRKLTARDLEFLTKP